MTNCCDLCTAYYAGSKDYKVILCMDMTRGSSPADEAAAGLMISPVHRAEHQLRGAAPGVAGPEGLKGVSSMKITGIRTYWLKLPSRQAPLNPPGIPEGKRPTSTSCWSASLRTKGRRASAAENFLLGSPHLHAVHPGHDCSLAHRPGSHDD